MAKIQVWGEFGKLFGKLSEIISECYIQKIDQETNERGKARKIRT